MKLNYIFGIACAQNPLTMEYRVERYQTQHRISGKPNIYDFVDQVESDLLRVHLGRTVLFR